MNKGEDEEKEEEEEEKERREEEKRKMSPLFYIIDSPLYMFTVY